MESINFPMRILVFGAGALGTYIGGSLALAGQRVVFLERPELVEGLRAAGLKLQIKDELHVLVNPEVVGSAGEVVLRAPYDVAILALKSFDTRPALENLAPYVDKLPPFLCLQNGVDNEATLEQILGPGKVIRGTVASAIRRNGPGDIVLERLRGIGIAAGHALTPTLATLFNQAGLNAQVYADGAAMKWSKMFTNLLANASSAILDMPPAQIFAHPGLYRMELAQLRETLEVMAALHLEPVDLPRTPVRLLAFAVRRLPAGLSRPLLGRAIGGVRGGKMPSFYIDLHNGRGQSEVDYLNGAVARYAVQCSRAAPVNRFLNQTLLDLTTGRIPLNTYARQPEKLLEDLAQKTNDKG